MAKCAGILVMRKIFIRESFIYGGYFGRGGGIKVIEIPSHQDWNTKRFKKLRAARVPTHRGGNFALKLHRHGAESATRHITSEGKFGND